MSDTQSAMREFRFLDEKRKTNGLMPHEEQRWQELAVALGIDLSAMQQPQGYYGEDGLWYQYPPGYDANAAYQQQQEWEQQQYYAQQQQAAQQQQIDPSQGWYDPNTGAWYPPQPQVDQQQYYAEQPQQQQVDPSQGWYDPNTGAWYPAQPQQVEQPQQQWGYEQPQQPVQPVQQQWSPPPPQPMMPAAPTWNPPAPVPVPAPSAPRAPVFVPPSFTIKPKPSAPTPVVPAFRALEEPPEVDSDEVMEIGDEEVVEIQPSIESMSQPPMVTVGLKGLTSTTAITRLDEATAQALQGDDLDVPSASPSSITNDFQPSLDDLTIGEPEPMPVLPPTDFAPSFDDLTVSDTFTTPLDDKVEPLAGQLESIDVQVTPDAQQPLLDVEITAEPAAPAWEPSVEIEAPVAAAPAWEPSVEIEAPVAAAPAWEPSVDVAPIAEPVAPAWEPSVALEAPVAAAPAWEPSVDVAPISEPVAPAWEPSVEIESPVETSTEALARSVASEPISTEVSLDDEEDEAPSPDWLSESPTAKRLPAVSVDPFGDNSPTSPSLPRVTEEQISAPMSASVTFASGLPPTPEVPDGPSISVSPDLLADLAVPAPISRTVSFTAEQLASPVVSQEPSISIAEDLLAVPAPISKTVSFTAEQLESPIVSQEPSISIAPELLVSPTLGVLDTIPPARSEPSADELADTLPPLRLAKAISAEALRVAPEVMLPREPVALGDDEIPPTQPKLRAQGSLLGSGAHEIALTPIKLAAPALSPPVAPMPAGLKPAPTPSAPPLSFAPIAASFAPINSPPPPVDFAPPPSNIAIDPSEFETAPSYAPPPSYSRAADPIAPDPVVPTYAPPPSNVPPAPSYSRAADPIVGPSYAPPPSNVPPAPSYSRAADPIVAPSYAPPPSNVPPAPSYSRAADPIVAPSYAPPPSNVPPAPSYSRAADPIVAPPASNVPPAPSSSHAADPMAAPTYAPPPSNVPAAPSYSRAADPIVAPPPSNVPAAPSYSRAADPIVPAAHTSDPIAPPASSFDSVDDFAAPSNFAPINSAPPGDFAAPTFAPINSPPPPPAQQDFIVGGEPEPMIEAEIEPMLEATVEPMIEAEIEVAAPTSTAWDAPIAPANTSSSSFDLLAMPPESAPRIPTFARAAAPPPAPPPTAARTEIFGAAWDNSGAPDEFGGAASEPVQLATNAEFLGDGPTSAPAEDISIDADPGEFVVESATAAELATDVRAGTAPEPPQERMELANNFDFIDNSQLTGTGEQWQDDRQSIALGSEEIELEQEEEEDVIQGTVLEEEEPAPQQDSWAVALSQPSPAPVVAPPPARPIVPPLARVATPIVQQSAPPPPPPSIIPQPVQPVVQAAPAGPAQPVMVPGEHRVILHTVEGQVKRGAIKDAKLGDPQLHLHLANGGTETLARERVKALFFMLAPGARAPATSGAKVRVTFKDGRQVAGYSNDHKLPTSGFFVVPADNRTNTERIFIFRHAVQSVSVEQ